MKSSLQATSSSILAYVLSAGLVVNAGIAQATGDILTVNPPGKVLTQPAAQASLSASQLTHLVSWAEAAANMRVQPIADGSFLALGSTANAPLVFESAHFELLTKVSPLARGALQSILPSQAEASPTPFPAPPAPDLNETSVPLSKAWAPGQPLVIRALPEDSLQAGLITAGEKKSEKLETPFRKPSLLEFLAHSRDALRAHPEIDERNPQAIDAWLKNIFDHVSTALPGWVNSAPNSSVILPTAENTFLPLAHLRSNATLIGEKGDTLLRAVLEQIPKEVPPTVNPAREITHLRQDLPWSKRIETALWLKLYVEPPTLLQDWLAKEEAERKQQKMKTDWISLLRLRLTQAEKTIAKFAQEPDSPWAKFNGRSLLSNVDILLNETEVSRVGLLKFPDLRELNVFRLWLDEAEHVILFEDFARKATPERLIAAIVLMRLLCEVDPLRAVTLTHSLLTRAFPPRSLMWDDIQDLKRLTSQLDVWRKFKKRPVPELHSNPNDEATTANAESTGDFEET